MEVKNVVLSACDPDPQRIYCGLVHRVELQMKRLFLEGIADIATNCRQAVQNIAHHIILLQLLNCNV